MVPSISNSSVDTMLFSATKQSLRIVPRCSLNLYLRVQLRFPSIPWLMSSSTSHPPWDRNHNLIMYVSRSFAIRKKLPGVFLVRATKWTHRSLNYRADAVKEFQPVSHSIFKVLASLRLVFRARNLVQFICSYSDNRLIVPRHSPFLYLRAVSTSL